MSKQTIGAATAGIQTRVQKRQLGRWTCCRCSARLLLCWQAAASDVAWVLCAMVDSSPLRIGMLAPAGLPYLLVRLTTRVQQTTGSQQALAFPCAARKLLPQQRVSGQLWPGIYCFDAHAELYTNTTVMFVAVPCCDCVCGAVAVLLCRLLTTGTPGMPRRTRVCC
jgi:hypothetical protein